GITLAAVLMLAGLRRGVAPVPLRRIAADVSRLVLAAAGACAAGTLAAGALDAPPVVRLAAGGLAVAAAFAVLAVLAGPDLVAPWIASRPLGGRHRRGRTESGDTSEQVDRTESSDRTGPSPGTDGRGHPARAAGADVPLGRPLR
ncbi:hypothetical protein AB0K37_36325, partial [Actinomadura sp. NPDC049753]